jgi:catechol 2,3-dioxygenase-like lactoylglutathione lyase family enzyme
MERDRAVLRCEIFPADLDATIAFYVGVLAFEVVRDERRSIPPYVALRRGAVALGAAARPPLSTQEHRRPPVGVELVLEVDDLDVDRARVDAAAWPVAEDITDRPWGLRDFRLLDPDGYYWRITTHPV